MVINETNEEYSSFLSFKYRCVLVQFAPHFYGNCSKLYNSGYKGDHVERMIIIYF